MNFAVEQCLLLFFNVMFSCELKRVRNVAQLSGNAFEMNSNSAIKKRLNIEMNFSRLLDIKLSICNKTAQKFVPTH